MGEAFKRKRCQAFENRRHEAHALLTRAELLALHRKESTRFTVSGRVLPEGGQLAVGAPCFLVPSGDDGYAAVVGNQVFAMIRDESLSAIREWAQAAPSAAGAFTCTLVEVGAFGSVTFELKPENDNGC